MTNNVDDEKLRKAREWAREYLEKEHFPHDEVTAAEVIESLPDEIVDGGKVRELIKNYKAHNRISLDLPRRKINNVLISDLEALLPKPRTLADMTPEEREACQWMQAKDDVGNRVVITELNEGNQEGTVLYENGGQYEWPYSIIVPLPDLRRMKWPAAEPVTESSEASSEPDSCVCCQAFEDVQAEDIQEEDENESECTCSPTPPVAWTTPYGAIDPVPMTEYEPSCPVHGNHYWDGHGHWVVNPTPLPAPEDCKPGEAWLVEVDGGRHPVVIDRNGYGWYVDDDGSVNVHLNATPIARLTPDRSVEK